MGQECQKQPSMNTAIFRRVNTMSAVRQKFWKRANADAVAESLGVQDAAHRQLGGGVARADHMHVPPAPRR